MVAVRLFAHRGLNRIAPENTFAAFRAAAAAGVSWVETDVDVLGDGTVIVCHDSTLDRTTNRSGSYRDLRREGLAGIDAGAWFGPEFVGEPLPTLGGLIALVNELGLNANIELKANEEGAERSRLLSNQVLAELENLAPDREVIISSFNHLLLAELKRAAPKWPVACLFHRGEIGPDWRSRLELVGADFIHPEDGACTRAEIAAFQAAGFGVNIWTVNTAARFNELCNWGVDGVFSDVADQFVR